MSKQPSPPKLRAVGQPNADMLGRTVLRIPTPTNVIREAYVNSGRKGLAALKSTASHALHRVDPHADLSGIEWKNFQTALKQGYEYVLPAGVSTTIVKVGATINDEPNLAGTSEYLVTALEDKTGKYKSLEGQTRTQTYWAPEKRSRLLGVKSLGLPGGAAGSTFVAGHGLILLLTGGSVANAAISAQVSGLYFSVTSAIILAVGWPSTYRALYSNRVEEGLRALLDKIDPNFNLNEGNLKDIVRHLRKGRSYSFPSNVRFSDVITPVLFTMGKKMESFSLTYVPKQKAVKPKTSKPKTTASENAPGKAEKASRTPAVQRVNRYEVMLQEQTQRIRETLELVRKVELTIQQSHQAERIETDIEYGWKLYDTHLSMLRTGRAVEAEAKLRDILTPLEREANSLLVQARSSVLNQMDVHARYVDSANQ